MRLSTDPDDPGYANFKRYFPVRVFLDGVEVPLCDLADEECGVVRACVLDKEGQIQTDPSNPDKFLMEIRYGKVEVVYPEGPN